MLVRKVKPNGSWSRAKPVASGTPSSTGNYNTINNGAVASATIFFIRDKDDGSGSWEEFGLTLTRAEFDIFRERFEG